MKFWHQKLQSWNVRFVIFWRQNICEKCALKTLMKLTPGLPKHLKNIWYNDNWRIKWDSVIMKEWYFPLNESSIIYNKVPFEFSVLFYCDSLKQHIESNLRCLMLLLMMMTFFQTSVKEEKSFYYSSEDSQFLTSFLIKLENLQSLS